MFTGGASAATVAVDTALIGDSLTDPAFGYTTFYWINGVLDGVLKVIANAGVSGDTVSAVLARVDNAYTDASPGLAGLGTLGRIFVRIGTNDARSSTAIAGALTTAYNSLMAKLAGYASKVVVLAVPPLDTATPNARVQDYNAFLAANYNSGQFTFVDDCTNVRDGSNNQIGAYFQDGVHFNNTGICIVGLDGGAALSSVITGYSSPLVTNPNDTYAFDHSTKQWFKNPTITGTGGTKGSGISGTVADNIAVNPNGAGVAATCSIVAADVGDPNIVSWQRIAITQGSTGTSLQISSTCEGRTITTLDPTSLDMIMEIRLNAFDSNKLQWLEAWVQGPDGEKLTKGKLRLENGTLTETVTLRHAIPRTTPANQASATFFLEAPFTGNFGPAASIGSFDFRCVSIRG